ncbi:MAG: endopeptidase La, partial [Verrucomicrobia bacterium]|nr:endopeptidase La [Verrucomicrobiota bacterium]
MRDETPPEQQEILNPEAAEGPKTPRSRAGEIVLARHTYPSQLIIVPLVHRPVFPRMTVPVQVEQPELIKALIALQQSDSRLVGLVLAKKADRGDRPIRGSDLHSVGVIAEIEQIAQANEHILHVILSATERFRIKQIVHETPIIRANVHYLIENEIEQTEETRAYAISLVQSIKELVALNPLHKEELSLFMSRTDLHDPGRLADIAAALTTANGEELQEILQVVSLRERLNKVLVLLRKEIDISTIQAKIGRQIEEKVSTQQREFFLREQLKAIKKELGLEREGKDAELEKFVNRLETLTLSEEARERIDEELDKLRLLEASSPEFNVSRTYLDWLTILPWGVYTEDTLDIQRASVVLNEDHYGLEDVKERILEFLAVGIQKGSVSGSILCFVGPPGVGKTSLGKSIARSMGRNFYRFSLGGMRDEAEIKGHRRTYIGALPGKFVQAFKTCKSANPVLMLDEIDKIGASYHGDPASALLEVLDPEQNSGFLDHYLDVRFDLSRAFFVCTANQTDTIPRPLLDRMEIIHLPGYILEEKLAIARQYLVPKQLRAHGLKRRQFSITSKALRHIIDGYAREPGVRGLEKSIGKIMRKSVKRVVEKKADAVKVDVADVE